MAGTTDDSTQDTTDEIQDIGGNPSAGSQDIYATANLKNLCIDNFECDAPYDVLPDEFYNTGNAQLTDLDICDFDYDPNVTSTFVLNRVSGSVNGLDLLFSKEDLFFLAWNSIRYQINPYFLMGVLATESRGNCAAVSASNGEGCFQITNTFGEAQLNDSYPDFVSDWFWTARSDDYYPDDVFVDELSYFGEQPTSDQFRTTLDPSVFEINDTEISSVVNFHFGVTAASLYFNWQQYLLFHHYDEIADLSEELFAMDDGKALWQAAAYNGGAYGASNALGNADPVEDFLDEMPAQTQNYAPLVVDYCKSYQAGEITYNATYTEAEVYFLVDLLAQTYPADIDIDWDEVKDDIHQIFFADGTNYLTFVDDVKALVYVISTFDPVLAPVFAAEGSI